MSKNHYTAKAGTLISVDQGQYSDYSVCGFFVVLKDFTPLDELDAYMEQHPDQRKQFMFMDMAFFAELIEKGFLLEIDYGNLYLGGYSDHEEVNFTPACVGGL